MAARVAAIGIDPTRSFRFPKHNNLKKDCNFRYGVPHLDRYNAFNNCYTASKSRMLLYYLSTNAWETAFHLEITDNKNYYEAKDTLMQLFALQKTQRIEYKILSALLKF